MNITIEVENEEKSVTTFVLGIMVFLAGCDYSKPEKQDGFFFNTFVQPMKHLLQWLEMMYLITTMD